MTREELQLLTLDQLNSLIDNHPGLKIYRMDYNVPVGVYLNLEHGNTGYSTPTAGTGTFRPDPEYRVNIMRDGSYGHRPKFHFEVSNNRSTGNLPQVSWQFKDWIVDEKVYGFKFVVPEELFPKGLAILMLMAIQEIHIHRPTSISS